MFRISNREIKTYTMSASLCSSELTMPNAAKTALLLIAHGSRNAQANDDLWFMVEALVKRGRYPIVEAAFLEIARPTIVESAQRCAIALFPFRGDSRPPGFAGLSNAADEHLF
jgi:hypothetical protein